MIAAAEQDSAEQLLSEDLNQDRSLQVLGCNHFSEKSVERHKKMQVAPVSLRMLSATSQEVYGVG